MDDGVLCLGAGLPQCATCVRTVCDPSKVQRIFITPPGHAGTCDKFVRDPTAPIPAERLFREKNR